MTDIVAVIFVVAFLALSTAIVASRQSPSIRNMVWLAFVEYLFGILAQWLYSNVFTRGGDATLYAKAGTLISRALQDHFELAWPEVISLLFQQPSIFDPLVVAGRSNTGSMCAVAGLLTTLLGGSEEAPAVLVGGLAMFGAINVFSAFRSVAPKVPEVRLFAASVLIPSIPFWTGALHKESFCLIGMGALFAAWSAVRRNRWVRAAVYGPLGIVIILLFRAPALLPFLLGIVTFVVVERIRGLRTAQAGALGGPIYMGIALGSIVVAVLVVSRLAPSLSPANIAETMAQRQASWSVSPGGSSIELGDGGAPSSLGGQLMRLPLALVNALLRPQLFDVHNFGALIGALETTVITVFIVRAIVLNGGRLPSMIQRSPFLAMCAVVTLIGSAIVGLATLNFGSIVRYRVPFLPFYGSLVYVMNLKMSRLPAARRAQPAPRPAKASNLAMSRRS